MDELIQHCLRELSFDGDLGEYLAAVQVADAAALCQGFDPCTAHHFLVSLFNFANPVFVPGCDVSRLRDFIKSFYSAGHRGSVHQQNVDDAFCAFVWSLVARQPGIRVGTVPPGSTVEVYVAPQPRAKSRVKGEEDVDDRSGSGTLNLVDNPTTRTLEDLQTQYGEGLRIAVDPEISYKAITGSHIRVSLNDPNSRADMLVIHPQILIQPSKMTPIVYTALQLITRTREKGLSVVDLGKKTGYDQKTCFYLIKVLVELDLV